VHVGEPARDLHHLRVLLTQADRFDLVDAFVVDLLARGAERQRCSRRRDGDRQHGFSHLFLRDEHKELDHRNANPTTPL
jgi:hypothetical protein